MRPHPVYVVGRSFGPLAAHPGGLGLFAGLEEWPSERRNLARYVVAHPAARDLFGGRTPCAASLRGRADCAESSRMPRPGGAHRRTGTPDHQAMVLLDRLSAQARHGKPNAVAAVMSAVVSEA
ncbi:MmyB family transcriptional regulator [Streptomyces sp. NPDC054834]